MRLERHHARVHHRRPADPARRRAGHDRLHHAGWRAEPAGRPDRDPSWCALAAGICSTRQASAHQRPARPGSPGRLQPLLIRLRPTADRGRTEPYFYPRSWCTATRHDSGTMSSSLVGAVSSLHTDAEMVITVTKFAEHTLGRTVVRSQDRAGFVVNTLLIPYLLSAIRMAETRLRQTLRRRRRHGTGLRSSDGPVEARRPDRPGRSRLHRHVPPRRVQETPLRPAAPDPARGRSRAARPQERPRLPHLRPGRGAPGSPQS